MKDSAAWTALLAASVLFVLSRGVLAGEADTSSPHGIWYLSDGEQRISLIVTSDDKDTWSAHTEYAEQTNPVVDLDWDSAQRTLRFREERGDQWRWYHTRLVEGVLKGRTADSEAGEPEPSTAAFTRHVTGWNSSYLDAELTPRVFDLVLNHHYLARLRIDSNGSGFAGHLKVYATNHPDLTALCASQRSPDPRYQYWSEVDSSSLGAACEEPQFDIDIHHWDGEQISFTRSSDGFWQTYTGTVEGRLVHGTFAQDGTPQIFPWFGARAEVLTTGLANADPDVHRNWQDRTRKQLAHLKMAGAPLPLSVEVNTLQPDLAPLPANNMPDVRDDNPSSWPQNYRMQELEFLYTLPNPYGPEPLHRRGHGYLARPDNITTYKRPAVLVLNGHGGSAWSMMNPNSQYWYGDSFARRGYIVLALDVSHRGFGDDPGAGNGPHPPIAAPGFSSDWEEEGERIWTAMRGLDYLAQHPEVDVQRLVVAGLSMGAEVAALVAAMDPRVRATVLAGYTPDFSVMAWNDNHPCWQWQHADIREYVEMSDYLSMISPRRVIVATGRLDAVFSRFEPPFASDKQVLRRSFAPHLLPSRRPLHYLHDSSHVFRVGDVQVNGTAASHVRVPIQQAPAAPWDLDWQFDSETLSLGKTLYELIGDGRDELFINGFESL